MIDYSLLGIAIRKLDEDITDEWYIFNIKNEKLDGTMEILCKHKNIDGKFKRVNLNVYEYGVLIKEYLEDYAKSLSLNGVWIDLNDLSKDEAFYFRHCYEVYDGLFQYDLIMKSEEL